jgi:hypothetical protein
MYDFECAVRGEVEMREIALDIQLGSPRYRSKCLAFENGRIAVATVRILSMLHTVGLE